MHRDTRPPWWHWDSHSTQTAPFVPYYFMSRAERELYEVIVRGCDAIAEEARELNDLGARLAEWKLARRLLQALTPRPVVEFRTVAAEPAPVWSARAGRRARQAGSPSWARRAR